MEFVFFCLDWGGIKAIIFFGNIKEKMNPFLFWVLFVSFGIAILAILWQLFKYISVFVVAILAPICPYRSFAVGITLIISIIYSCFFLYTYWFLHRNILSFRDVVFGLILTGSCILLCLSFVRAVVVSYRE